MNVRQLIKELQKVKESLQDKEVFVMGENGLNIPPEIKYVLNDFSKMDMSKKNVDYIVLR